MTVAEMESSLAVCEPRVVVPGSARRWLSRAERLLARVRRRQLDLALRGDVMASARHADRAHRVRRRLQEL